VRVIDHADGLVNIPFVVNTDFGHDQRWVLWTDSAMT
jgi:hypothetical protein